MSAARDRLNARALAALDAPLETTPQLQVAAAAAGGGSARPIDWQSPDETVRLRADAVNTTVQVRLDHTCGSSILLRIAADGSAAIRIIGCDGVGYKLTPTGLTQVTVTVDGETGEETEADGEDSLTWITVTGCVDGVNRSIRVLGAVIEE